MNSTFKDLRFTSQDGLTSIPYWIESYTANSSAIVWVKVPSIPTSGVNVYMYYGTQTVSASNPLNVFDLYDTFDGSSLNTAAWDNYGASQTGGYAYVHSEAGGLKGIISKASYPINSTLEYEISYSGDVGDQGTGFHGFWQAWNSGHRTTFDEGCGAWQMCIRQTTSSSQVISTGALLNSYWSSVVIKWRTGGTNFYALRSDGWSYSNTLSSYNPTVNLKVAFGASDTSSAYGPVQMWVYWVRVRKYATVEPSGVFSSEEAGR